jgi:hypothetical protein
LPKAGGGGGTGLPIGVVKAGGHQTGGHRFAGRSLEQFLTPGPVGGAFEFGGASAACGQHCAADGQTQEVAAMDSGWYGRKVRLHRFSL